jgi:hypothetical protein
MREQPEVSSKSIALCHNHFSSIIMVWHSGVSILLLRRGLILRERRGFVLLALVEVKRLLDLLAKALAVGGLARAVTSMLLLVYVASTSTLFPVLAVYFLLIFA